MSPTISVVTPTYDRAGTLPRLYRSLVEQGFRDFEWVVVDDGSTDGTGEMVEKWAREAPFHIAYSRQPNQGKHVAFNRCVDLAAGEFCALIDSDDWYMPDGLEGMIECWRSIPEGRRDGFANVEGLRVHADGSLVGDRFPSDVFDSDVFELNTVHKVHGDKVGMYRRDVLREYPFPEDLGWHVPPSLVWHRIAARYATRFVNQVWAYTDYQPEGLSARSDDLRLRFAPAQLRYWDEFVAMPRRMPARVRYRAHANRIRYRLLTGGSLPAAVRTASSPVWALAAAPAGLLLYLRDRRAATAVEDGAG